MSTLSGFLRARFRGQTDHSPSYKPKIISRYRRWRTPSRQISWDEMGHEVDRQSTHNPPIEAVEVDRQSTQNPPIEAVEVDPYLGEPLAGLTSTPATATPYHCLPLATPKSTRVLRILPPAPQDEDNIKCQLEMISLDDDPLPEYHAVSYVWGSESKTMYITINNQPFIVRKNLWTFLNHMRNQGFQGLLWIDAICIDQDCIPERNHQVSVMGEIYKCAIRVLAWLGPESSIVSFDQEKVKQPGGNTPQLENLLVQSPILDSIRFMTEELSILLRSGANRRLVEVGLILVLLFKRLKDLVSAAYWSRMWIVQEYILARDISILTDRSQMTGNELFTVCNAFRNNSTGFDYGEFFRDLKHNKGLLKFQEAIGHGHLADMEDEIRKSISIMKYSAAFQIMERREDLHSTSRIAPLEDWVAMFQDLKCFDPRDHVYALLSLTKPDDLAFYELSPDYGKSELLLYIQLAYGLWKREEITRSLLLGRVLGIKAKAVAQVNDKVRDRVHLDRSLGRQSSPQKVAEELAPLIIQPDDAGEVEDTGYSGSNGFNTTRPLPRRQKVVKRRR